MFEIKWIFLRFELYIATFWICMDPTFISSNHHRIFFDVIPYISSLILSRTLPLMEGIYSFSLYHYLARNVWNVWVCRVQGISEKKTEKLWLNDLLKMKRQEMLPHYLVVNLHVKHFIWHFLRRGFYKILLSVYLTVFSSIFKPRISSESSSSDFS